MSYILMTDSNCDLPDSLAKELNLTVIPMEFIMEDKCYKHYLDAREMSLNDFYSKLKSGVMSKTTQINYTSYTEYFEEYLKQGKDILFVCFTSGMSGSYNTSLLAIEDLKKKYPERKIIAVDSKCASVGLGYLMYYVGKKYNEGMEIEELAEYAEDMKHKIGHWFVVDDLEQLKRGGRISAVTATFGKALQIKPLISVDEEGKLVTVGKIRGASKVYDALIAKMERDGEDYKNQTVFIGHADAIDKAQELQKRVAPMVKDTVICDIGPVIGTHVGSGMVALLFLGKRDITM